MAVTDEHTEVQEPAAKVTARKMFQYSAFVHVGDGAEECPTATAIAAGEDPPVCDDPDHFHAWIRLPNPYQHEDIRKKAFAAKARRLRDLRDPESDASIVLDEAIESLHAESNRERIIDDLLMAEWTPDYIDAQSHVADREEFEHVDQDREEYRRLDAEERSLPADEQSEDYKRLVAHLDKYAEAVQQRLDEIQEPKRDALRAQSLDELLAKVRANRVQEQGDRAFLESYDPWMWFIGTFKVDLHPTLRRPHIPMWESIGRPDRAVAGAMFTEAPEVIAELKTRFNELQLALQRGSSGN